MEMELQLLPEMVGLVYPRTSQALVLLEVGAGQAGLIMGLLFLPTLFTELLQQAAGFKRAAQAAHQTRAGAQAVPQAAPA